MTKQIKKIKKTKKSPKKLPTVHNFIGDKATYDMWGQIIWGNNGEEMQMLLDVRGWGAIQNLFDDEDKAADFQDKLGKWYVEAINEKLEREKNPDKDLGSDIRNKLSPINNLIAMIDDTSVRIHEDDELELIIRREITQCKESIKYLENL